MMTFLIYLYRQLLKLRYRFVLKGEEHLKQSGPIFFLGNHQALIDPQMNFIHIRKYRRVIPVVVDTYTKAPLLKQILGSYDTIAVADLSSGNRDLSVLERVKTSVINALREGKNVMLYPSGQLSVNGKERIQNKKSAYEIVKDLPEGVRVIGVRVDGLWGSMWSRAYTGKTPPFFKLLLKGIGYYFINLFFFMPRREIRLEWTDITEDAKNAALGDRNQFNKYLEEFFNEKLSDQPVFVRHWVIGCNK
jgi:long-chain-fatty-acid--[acyl-carrier-protein] ligase